MDCGQSTKQSMSWKNVDQQVPLKADCVPMLRQWEVQAILKSSGRLTAFQC